MSHWSSNANYIMNKKVPVIFHNLESYDSHLIFKELSKFNKCHTKWIREVHELYNK